MMPCSFLTQSYNMKLEDLPIGGRHEEKTIEPTI